ncbi:Uncharacterised protein [Bordetella pertussis]|nr:Uncharacterised protein [Bordetella pertussis]
MSTLSSGSRPTSSGSLPSVRSSHGPGWRAATQAPGGTAAPPISLPAARWQPAKAGVPSRTANSTWWPREHSQPSMRWLPSSVTDQPCRPPGAAPWRTRRVTRSPATCAGTGKSAPWKLSSRPGSASRSSVPAGMSMPSTRRAASSTARRAVCSRASRCAWRHWLKCW